VPQTPGSLPDFVNWPSFPFEGDLRVKELDDPVAVEPPRKGEDANECVACNAPDEAYIWVSERWRVRAMDRPTGLPMVIILESRSHLDLGDLPNLLAAELGVMTVRLEKAIRSLDGVARVHVNRWGDGSAHLHMWFLARPTGRLQLRGTFLSLWDDILPPIPEGQWRENLALVAAWLAEFGGRPLAEPPRIDWKAPSSFDEQIMPLDADADDLADDAAEYADSASAGGAATATQDAGAETPAIAEVDGSIEPASDSSPATEAGPAGQGKRRGRTSSPTGVAKVVPAQSVPGGDAARDDSARAEQRPANGDGPRADGETAKAGADPAPQPA